MTGNDLPTSGVRVGDNIEAGPRSVTSDTTAHHFNTTVLRYKTTVHQRVRRFR